MNLKIVAKSDRGVFVGLEEEGYAVISVDGVGDINIGDILSSPTWTDRDGLFKGVINITRGKEVRICIENWYCSQKVAYEFLGRLNSPTEVVTSERK